MAKYFVLWFHYLRTRKQFRNNRINRSIIRRVHNMVPNSVEERGGVQYKRNGPLTLLWGTPETTSTDAWPCHPNARDAFIARGFRYYGQKLSFNTYRKQLIQQTTLTNPVKCSWEVQLNEPSLHASVQSNLKMVRQCEQSITCSQALTIRKLRRRKQTVTFQKIIQLPSHDLLK